MAGNLRLPLSPSIMYECLLPESRTRRATAIFSGAEVEETYPLAELTSLTVAELTSLTLHA